MKIKNSLKKSFSTRQFKKGGMQSLMIVLVVAIVLVVNLIAGKMDISVDLSSDSMYSLSEDTKKIADGLTDDITIYYLCQEGNETIQTSGSKAIDVEKILKQYDGLKHITVEKKDPVLYPNFSKTYTDDDINNNDVIVVDNKTNQSKHVSVNDMIQSEMDYSSYQYVPTAIDIEGQVSAAIQSLTSTDSKKVYVTTGHGEYALSDMGSQFTDILDKSNFTEEDLDTTSAKSIPDDCDILLVNGPKYDFSDTEYEMIHKYLEQGGNAMFLINISAESTDNYFKLMSDYGVQANKGVVVDSDQAVSSSNPLFIDATVESHDITDDAGSTKVYIYNTAGVNTISNVRSTLSVTPLLSSSDNAYSRTDNTATDYTKQVDSDVKGPFNYAVAVTDAVNSDDATKNPRIVVFGSPSVLVDDYISTNQYGNRSIITNTMSWLSGSDELSTLAIPSRSISEEKVTMNAAKSMTTTVLLVIVIPLAMLLAGFVIWIRRRKS
ncbi:MAG: GldG family protein [Eubacterium sp.]|nr:GldG family protein [Eubacterium sp.]